jgi:serine/threonine-protein kinase
MPSRYEVLVKIAAGGMGTVHLGVERGRTRPLLAIKVPHPHLLDDPSFRRAVVRESRHAARIRDPHVVAVIGVDDDGAALAMEYVEGAPLGDLVAASAERDERLPPAIVVRILLDAAAGLTATHGAGDESGIVHRDVSPQNVIVGADGVAKLADFGLAKSLAGDEASTTQDTLKGKLGYLAPEYVRGKPIDARVDLFALGVVAWESFAGRRLFRGTNDAETLERVLRADVPALASIDPALGPFDPFVSHLLARDPALRTQTAARASEELLAIAAPRGLVADRLAVAAVVERHAGTALRARRAAVEALLGARLRKRTLTVAAATTGLATAALAIAVVAHLRASAPPSAAPPASSTTPVVAATAAAPSATGSEPAIAITDLPPARSLGTTPRPHPDPSAPPPARASASHRTPPPNPYRTP